MLSSFFQMNFIIIGLCFFLTCTSAQINCEGLGDPFLMVDGILSIQCLNNGGDLDLHRVCVNSWNDAAARIACKQLGQPFTGTYFIIHVYTIHVYMYLLFIGAVAIIVPVPVPEINEQLITLLCEESYNTINECMDNNTICDNDAAVAGVRCINTTGNSKVQRL